MKDIDYSSYSLDKLSELLASNMKNKIYYRSQLCKIESNCTIKENFKGKNLRRISYSQCTFDGANLEKAGLTDAYFDNCKFIGNTIINATTMNYSIYHKCIFNITISNTNFDNSLFIDCEFDCDMSNNIFTRCRFVHTSFNNFTMDSCLFDEAVFQSASSITNVKLRSQNFEGVYWESIELKDMCLPFPTIPYILNGLNTLAPLTEGKYNITVTSHSTKYKDKNKRMPLKEYFNFVPILKAYYEAQPEDAKDYLPLAIIYDFDDEVEKAYNAVFSGIEKAIKFRHYKMIKPFCKFIQISDKFSPHQKSETFKKILQITDKFKQSRSSIDMIDLGLSIAEAKEILLSTNAKPYSLILFDTDIPSAEYKTANELMRAIDMSIEKVTSGQEIMYHTEVRHNSPYTLLSTIMANPDVIVQILNHLFDIISIAAASITIIDKFNEKKKLNTMLQTTNNNTTNNNITINNYTCNIYVANIHNRHNDD